MATSRVRTRLTGQRLNGADLIFTNDLLDSTSQTFLEYQNIYCTVFINFLRGRLGAILSINCFVTAFTSGSVTGEMEIEMGANSQTEADQLAQSVTNMSAIANNNMTGNGDFLETSAISASDVDECTADSTLCANGMCVNTVGSYTCTCDTGYTQNGANNACIDVDECGVTGLCTNGRCVNTDGSYACLCDFGYVLNAAGDTCNANAGVATSQVRTALTGERLNGVPLEFSIDLLDTTSQLFREYQNIYCTVFINFVRSRLSGLLNANCFVTSFTTGSVIATMDLEIGASSQTVADQLAQDIIDLSGVSNINMTGNGDFLETSAISSARVDGQGGQLSAGAIIGIALGVFGFILIFISCVCCIFMQGVRRSHTTKLMHSGQRYDEPPRVNGGFHDNWSDADSLDERRFAVGRALDRLRKDERTYGGDFDGERGIPRRGREAGGFRTPYVADGSEANQSVERNPIHF